MAAAPLSKRVKRAPAQVDDNDSDETEPIASPPSKKGRLCIICGVRTTEKVKKNNNFEQMLQLYFCTLGVDVKPEACKKTDICQKCFDDVLYYSEINDIIVYFENFFKSMRSNLVKKTLTGLKNWEKDGTPLTKIHHDLKQKFPEGSDTTEHEEEQVKMTLAAYYMKSRLKDGETTRTITLTKKSDDDAVKKKQTQKISLKTGNRKATGESSETEDSE